MMELPSAAGGARFPFALLVGNQVTGVLAACTFHGHYWQGMLETLSQGAGVAVRLLQVDRPDMEVLARRAEIACSWCTGVRGRNTLTPASPVVVPDLLPPRGGGVPLWKDGQVDGGTEPLVDYAGAARIMRMSRSWVSKETRAGRLQRASGTGRSVRFDPAVLRAHRARMNAPKAEEPDE